ncbi:DoxX family protein [Microvirga flavescens]|uniref:DoxX family protein n=1 Tax=Microvirga flavescens TaxID=2249811 RepID=UPI000DDA5861|nr:DoxX family protein [Microvirga flavescens]
MTPRWVQTILSNKGFEIFARVLFMFVFLAGGLSKVLDFQGGLAEMRHFNLEPAVFFNVLTALVLLVGAVLIILDKVTWLAAGALGVFTFLTILIVHRFWALEGQAGVVALHTATEHLSVIGALMLVAIYSERSKKKS